jgi:hypothetical protein
MKNCELRCSNMPSLNINSFHSYFKVIWLFSNIFLLSLQVIFYASEISVSESVAAWLSILSAILLILILSSIDLSAKNWMLWFAVFYFLLYQFGAMFGLIFLGSDVSVLNYDTTFGNGASESSRIISYFLSGITASFLSILCYLLPPRLVAVPVNDKYLERFSFLMWAFPTPFVLVHYIWLFNTFSASYALAYSAEGKEFTSIVPFHWIFVNLFSIGFFLWFASVPSEKNFNKGLYIFIFVSLASSLYGGRIHLIIPLMFIIWYRSLVYGRELGRSVLYIGGVVILAFIFIVEMFRNKAGLDSQVLAGFLAASLSKGQYILSLYVDSKDLIDKGGSIYWLSPLVFPYDYFLHGGALVGQGEESAAIRGDLNHIMSSTLNYEAYIAGAGTGSSLVAEAYQFGLIGLFPLLTIFYLFYREIFGRMSRRIFLMISSLVFMHFIFTGRDSLFINSWGILKLIFAFYCVKFFILLIRTASSKLTHRLR